MAEIKAIIPAAGFGTRFLPLTKAQPKEMLPVVDRPTIQWVVEEAVEAGITDILIITGRGIHSEGGKYPVQAMVKKFLHSAEARNMGVKNVQPDGQGGAFRVDLYTPGQAPKPTPDP